MIVIDVNLLLYAYVRSASAHLAAKAWLERVFTRREPLGLPWQSVSAFLRIATNPNIPVGSMTMDQCIAIVEQWFARPQVRLITPTDRHWEIYRNLLLDGQVRGTLTSDAELAALTIEYGGVLHTTDRDFARFPGLRWINPLQS
ncbi:MAG: TA system VapC family ribonuclease toxin [Acidobacteriaceae bacterium]